MSTEAYVLLFTLAMFLGLELITKVPATLHTPLMSGSNAISGITIFGAITLAGQEGANGVTLFLAGAALACAAINVIGGYLVTDRMLEMFKKKPSSDDTSSAGGV